MPHQSCTGLYLIPPPRDKHGPFLPGPRVYNPDAFRERERRRCIGLLNAPRCIAMRRYDGQQCQQPVKKQGDLCAIHDTSKSAAIKRAKRTAKRLAKGQGNPELEARKANRRLCEKNWRDHGPWWPGSTIALSERHETGLNAMILPFTNNTPLGYLPAQISNWLRWQYQQTVIDGRGTRMTHGIPGEDALRDMLRLELPKRIEAAGPCPVEFLQDYPLPAPGANHE